MLTEFMRDWHAESCRWVDAMLKTVRAESDANAEQLQRWIAHWQPRVIAALQPLANASVGVAALDEVVGQFDQRLKKLGLVVEEVAA